MLTAQLDLFAVDAAPGAAPSSAPVTPSELDRMRIRDALTALRDSVSDAVEIVTHLSYPPGRCDNNSARAGGGWAYCDTRAGMRVESASTWPGWPRLPAHLTTWDELHALLGHDPRRAEIAAWVASLPQPRWKTRQRPHELWPDGDCWHISYYCRDHVDTHWTRRREVWQLLHDLLTDAITTLEGGTSC